MKSAQKKLMAFIFLSFSLSAHAESIFPHGCETTGFGFSKNFLILNESGQQTFYLIQNRSNKTLQLEHHETQEDEFMSPKLESQLQPLHWSAFASDVGNLYVACFTQQGEEKIAVNCAEVLDVCQYPRVKFALSNQGTYWVSTDKPRQQVLGDATAKGIFLHW